MSNKRVIIILAAIFLLSLAIRTYFALTCDAIPDYSDMARYSEEALKRGFPTSLPPGYPLFLRVIYAIFGAYNYTAVFVIQGIISSLTVLLIYWVGDRIRSATTGLIAAGVSAVYPNFIVYNLTTLTETIGVLFVMLLLAAIVSPISDRKRSILAAVVLCIGYAFRPVILFFTPGAFLSLRKRIVFIISLAFILGPLITYGMLTGKSSHRGARAFYKTYNPKSNGQQYVNLKETELGSSKLPSKIYIKAAFTFIKKNGWKTVDIIYNKTAIVLSRGWDKFVMRPIVGYRRGMYYIMTYAYVPIMLLGFFGMIRYYDHKNKVLTSLTLSYLVLIIVIAIFKFRYRLLVEPMLIVCAAIFINERCKSFVMPNFNLGWIRRWFSPPNHQVSDDTPKWRQILPTRLPKDWDFLLVILLLAVALRLYFALAFDVPPDSKEMEVYNKLAVEGGLGTENPPLYPLFLRALYSIFGDYNSKAVSVAQGIINSIVVLLMYGIVTRLYNRTAGLIAAAISAVYPNFIIYNITTVTESLVIFLVVLVMAVTSKQMDERYRSTIIAVLVGLGILLKPVFVCFTPGLLLVVKRRRLFLLILMITLIPYTVRNTAIYKRTEPVYDTWVYELNLKNFTDVEYGWHTVDKIYNNASIVLNKGWGIGDISTADDTIKNSTYTGAYTFTFIMLLGLIGLSRCYKKDHRETIFPVLFYIVLLIIFSKLKLNFRVVIEPVLIAYTAMLVSGKRIKGE